MSPGARTPRTMVAPEPAPKSAARQTVAPKTVLFFRRLRGLTGGHLKVWDFFQHTLASGTHTARIVFSADSVWTSENPWRDSRRNVVAARKSVTPDLFFLGALDWEHLTPEERAHSKIPVLNLIAGVRHANADDPRRAMLRHRAIRICVSREVAEAIRRAGPPNGPVVVIPNAVNIADAPAFRERDVELLIVATKQPSLGRKLAARLVRQTPKLEILETRVPRAEFLARVARAKVAVFLPLAAEGFYLPALEAMALGTVVVCPDAVGNREFCVDRVNSFLPEFDEEAIVVATGRALAQTPKARAEMVAAGTATAARHGLEAERRAFVELLRRAPQMWS